MENNTETKHGNQQRIPQKGVNFSGEDTFGALQFARDGIEDDEERYDCATMGVAQSSTVPGKGHVAVPEARPWHEWCRSAEDGVLDLCKRCGRDVFTSLVNGRCWSASLAVHKGFILMTWRHTSARSAPANSESANSTTKFSTSTSTTNGEEVRGRGTG